MTPETMAVLAKEASEIERLIDAVRAYACDRLDGADFDRLTNASRMARSLRIDLLRLGLAAETGRQQPLTLVGD